ncbi:hypothetical protein AcW1_001842 [Taiwanofungus camphoratus]|nr:hypothetical protein AcV5_000108 [Antrodia cinnamomea]KAI0945676.1 hypothetical protein AcW1_001842 [Antrodia cinnamomea]
MSTPPPPLSSSSSSSSTSSPSPTIDQTQLKSDCTDPLDFLLQSLPQNVTDSGNSPDWSQLSAWTRTEPKLTDFSTDFDLSLPMDFDFDPTMAVDPSALHFNSLFDLSGSSSGGGLQLPVDNSFLMSTEPVHGLLQVMPEESSSSCWPAHGRRLSMSSSSSSSGASLSPFLEHSSVSSSPPSDSGLSSSDPAQELAHRVRQMAGVTLAVPVSAQIQQMAAAGGQSKLPIPRLTRPSVPPASSKHGSAKASPVTESSPSSSVSSSNTESPGTEVATPPPPPVTSVIGRPKTSHTTIERRYRTNLNARITGLKQAVPALRVLEAKNNGGHNPYNDVVDVRGFVDGVRAARKMSKANILGKAAEYIKVLKKREGRLKREQDGLKSLIGGLVGGPALLKEWEREWRERFGGEEKDEIEEERTGAASDDEDGDGEESDGDDEEGRAHKKAKVAKAPKKDKPPRSAPQPVPSMPAVAGAVPEKRKRGRPRKIPLPPAPVPPSLAAPSPLATAPVATNTPPIFPTDVPMQEQATQLQAENTMQAQPAQQYLLAAFAFFSVFNSPLASSSRAHAPTETHTHHTHHGAVLTAHPPTQSYVPTPSDGGLSSYGWHETVQAMHLLVSTLVFFYVLLPWLSGALRHMRVTSKLSSYLSGARSRIEASCTAADVPNPETIVRTVKSRERYRAALMDTLLDALAPARRGSTDEAARLRAALGVSTGLVGLMQGVIKAGRVDRGIESNQLEQRAWVRLGELVAFDGKVGKATRMQTYWCMSWHISTFAASTTDLSTLALIMRPVSSSKAAALWESAGKREFLRPHAKIVLDNMSVELAADWLAKWQSWHEGERKTRCAACEKRTPLGVLAAILIRERLRKHAAALFVRTVVRNASECPVSDCDDDCYVYDAEKDLKEEEERRETIEAGKSIGGRTAELAMLLERIWDTGFCTHEDVLPVPRRVGGCSRDQDADCEDAQDLASTDEAEIRALLSATIIYRRIFPSSFPACSTSMSFILSPPPSPSQRNAALHTALRTALSSPAFDYASGGRLEDEELSGALEESRDRVNDMLVELERSCRRVGRY